MYPLTVERADTSRLERPIVKVDVHAPIFYFPKNNQVVYWDTHLCRHHKMDDFFPQGHIGYAVKWYGRTQYSL